MWIFRNLTWISLFWSFFVFELQIDRSQSLERVGGTDLNPETHTIQIFEIPHQISDILRGFLPFWSLNFKLIVLKDYEELTVQIGTQKHTGSTIFSF